MRNSTTLAVIVAGLLLATNTISAGVSFQQMRSLRQRFPYQDTSELYMAGLKHNDAVCPAVDAVLYDCGTKVAYKVQKGIETIESKLP